MIDGHQMATTQLCR